MKKSHPLYEQGSPSHGQFTTDTSTDAQRSRLLGSLQLGPIDTLTARRELNILAPAARVKELREAGHNIITQRIRLIDEQGHTHHNVALYYLSTGTTGSVALAA